MKKRLIAAVLITAFSITACGKSTGEALEEIITATEEIMESDTVSENEDVEISLEENEPAHAPAVMDDTKEDEALYEFNPHVFSARDAELWGEETKVAFFNFVDAIRNGEDTFECPNETVYYNVVGGRLINYYFPVASTLIKDGYYESTKYDNGVGLIPYGPDKESFGLCGRGDESREYFVFSATDDSYADLRWGYFLEMDTDNNIVTFCDYSDYETKEFKYSA